MFLSPRLGEQLDNGNAIQKTITPLNINAYPRLCNSRLGSNLTKEAFPVSHKDIQYIAKDAEIKLLYYPLYCVTVKDIIMC